MRRLAILVAVALAGCGKGKADRFEEILTQLEKFKTEMCACTDVACADRVSEARRDFKKTMREKLDRDAKPTQAQDQKGKAVEAELQACRKKLTDAQSTGSDQRRDAPVGEKEVNE